jgi:hypothetical protein
MAPFEDSKHTDDGVPKLVRMAGPYGTPPAVLPFCLIQVEEDKMALFGDAERSVPTVAKMSEPYGSLPAIQLFCRWA